MNTERKGMVVSNREIAPGIYDMTIHCPKAAEQAQCGQFIHVLCRGGGAFLRRPISVCDSDEKNIRIVYEVKGEGTRLLSRYRQGVMVDFLGPLGHGFTVDKKAKNPLVIGGGIGVYPLLKLAKSLNAPRIFLGFRSASRITLAEEFEKIGTLEVATDDGSYGYHGLVLDLAKRFLENNQSERIYACGPRPMLKAVKELAESQGIPAEISMEERMGCGIGACLVCACKTKAPDGWKHSHVCKDGPVFDSRDVIFEEE